MTTKTFFQTMADGTQININRWIPDDEAKGIIVISHGMAEHGLRYDRTASIFADAGFIVSAHDHRGHGKTAQNQKENGEPGFGYLSDKKGFEKTRDDLYEVVEQIKKDFPSKKVILLGHSWGSMIAQSFIEKYGNSIDGCILSGTRGPDNIGASSGLFLAKLLYLAGQKKRISNIIDSIAFGGYSKKLPKGSEPYDWLSHNKMNIEMYKADQWCGFKMTTEFYHEMFRMLKSIHKKSNMKKIPASLPVLFVTGTEDPVGVYTKTVKNLCSIYQKNGMSDVNAKYYIDYRHETLNETNSEIVHDDIIEWISKHI
ncbi:MAG: lysophospholipase [Treponema sp.]|nr:lysophospholipase [Candidatus Treponema merdequi]